MLDCGAYHGQGNIEGDEKGYGGGVNRLRIRYACSDGGSVFVGNLVGPQSDGRLYEYPVLTATRGGPPHYSVSIKTHSTTGGGVAVKEKGRGARQNLKSNG